MISTYIQQHKVPFETKMFELIESQNIPASLKESMLYSLKVGGKRLRPLLLFSVLDTFHQSPKIGYQVAAALEMIHTYSLIHDDLPAMDNDELRRGKPTNHIVFGEATAILAGDSLLTHAFKIIADDEGLTPLQRLNLINELSIAAGPMGMVAGQVLDMQAETTPVSLEGLKNIHVNKTGRLIEFAIVSGAIMAQADEKVIDDLRLFAYHLGLAFQIKDDILDVEGDTNLIGKKVGSDLVNGKSTYVSLTSLESAKEMLDYEIKSAKSILKKLELSTEGLEAITDYIKDRQV